MQSLLDAYALLQKGDLGKAEAICRSVVAREADPGAYRMLAEISRLKHDLPAAVAYARRALELGPDHPDSLFCCGSLLLQSGDLDGAIQHLDRAIERRLRFDKAHDALCVALERRAKFEGRFPVSVITATTGNPKLQRAIESVQAQTYPRVEHVVVIDGPSGAESVRRMLPSGTTHDIQVMPLPFNTGADGYNGHRIYAACIYLANGRYISFLDEDNWFEPHHIQSLMRLVEAKGLEWAYALRNIVDADGRFVTQDNCESLGAWPTWNAPGSHLVDMNCYLIRRDIAIGASPVFHRRIYDLSPDFELCRFLLGAAKRFDTNGDYTVNYTAANTSNSVKSDFFTTGNRAMFERYRGNFPWRKRPIQASASQAKFSQPVG
jgi:hypothetical protein